MSDLPSRGMYPATMPLPPPSSRRDYGPPPPPRDQPYWDDPRDMGRRGSYPMPPMPYQGGGHMGGPPGGGYDRYDSRPPMRPRSPSPDFDDRRKRRRSATPPRYGYNDRGPPPHNWNGQSFPPPPRGGAPSGQRPAPPPARVEAPISLPFLVSPTYFLSWLRQSKSNVADPTLEFRKYRSQFFKREYQRYFDEHKDAAWFVEKYGSDKEFEEAREERKEKGREGKVDEFYNQLVEGKFDDLTFDYADHKSAAPAASEDDSAAKDDGDDAAREGDSANGMSGPKSDLVPLSTSSKQLIIKAVAPDVSRLALEKHLAQASGFEYLALTEPKKDDDYVRVGIATWKDAGDVVKAQELLNEGKIEDFTLDVSPNDQATTARLQLTPGIFSLPARIAQDLESVRKAVALFEAEQKDTRASTFIEKKSVSDKKKLDLYLQYLRKVFHTCFYCVATCDFAEELERKCPLHLRRDAGIAQPIRGGSDDDPVAKFDDKLPLLLERGTVDPGLFGGDSPEAELNRLCEPVVKREDEGKFRCQQCNKLFSALKFIQKHVCTKHPEIIGDNLEKLKFFNNFVLDPSHPPYGALESIEPPQPPAAAPSRSGASASGSVNGSVGIKPLQDRLGEMPPLSANALPFVPRNGGPVDRPPKRRRDDDDYRRPRGPPPPPPPGVALDPRAAKGASSYADLDGAPSGAADDVVLPY